MKRLPVCLIIITIFAISLASCKKSSTGISTSQWSLNGKTYTGTTTLLVKEDTVAYILESTSTLDSITNFIEIGFKSNPVNNKKFAVAAAYGSSSLDSVHCIIVAGYAIPPSTNGLIGESFGNPGDSVSITIVNGKVHATFSNIITMGQSSSLFGALSGTIIQQ